MVQLAPTVNGPRDLPELRHWMVKQARMLSADFQTFVGGEGRVPKNATGLTAIRSEADWLRSTIGLAPLWWVEPEMCDLVAEAAPSLPDDYVLKLPEVLPVTGMAVFAKELSGIDALSGGETNTGAIIWGPLTYPGGEAGVGIGILAHQRLEDGLTAESLTNQSMVYLMMRLSEIMGMQTGPLSGDLYAYIGRTDWLDNHAITFRHDETPNRPNIEIQQASMIEDRKIFATLLNLVAQRRMVTITTHKLDRPTRRRAERKGYGTDVRVLTLSPRSHPAASADSACGSQSHVEWKHSWIVSPHWRWQAVGEGRKERRLTLVNSYAKGDPAKPLLGGERVWRVPAPPNPPINVTDVTPQG